MNRLLASVITLCLSTVAVLASDKPIVLIVGEGNIEVNSDAGAVGGYNWAAGFGTTRINKHNQTMEMAQNYLANCPELQITLDGTTAPDYYVALNREGGAYNIGQSQVMVLNRRKVVIFVTKKMTVKNAVKSTCNAIAADWQANGRLQVPTLAPQTQTAPNPNPIIRTPRLESTMAAVPNSATVTTTNVSPSSAVSVSQPSVTVALDFQITARAEKYCKPDTIADIQRDIRAYLTAKDVAIGVASDSTYTLTFVINRPLSKWLEITIQAREHKTQSLLWSDKVSDGSWGHLGGAATIHMLDKLHAIIDAKLGVENGVPLLVAGTSSATKNAVITPVASKLTPISTTTPSTTTTPPPAPTTTSSTPTTTAPPKPTTATPPAPRVINLPSFAPSPQ